MEGVMDIFEKLESGAPVDMYTAEYRPVVEELHRTYKALHRLNGAEPLSEEQRAALEEDLRAAEAAEQKSREEYAQKSDTIRRDVAAPVSEEPAVETEADDNPVDDDDAPVVDFGD